MLATVATAAKRKRQQRQQTPPLERVERVAVAVMEPVILATEDFLALAAAALVFLGKVPTALRVLTPFLSLPWATAAAVAALHLELVTPVTTTILATPLLAQLTAAALEGGRAGGTKLFSPALPVAVGL
jgi:hypothetical protein